MCMKRIILLVAVSVYVILSAEVSAQKISQRHIPLLTDSLDVYKIPAISIGNGGENCTWNFSDLDVSTALQISEDYFSPAPNLGNVGLHRENANYYYTVEQDTLRLTGFETSDKHIRYSSSIPMMAYPFAYGDSLVYSLTGEGQYCHIFPFPLKGKCVVRAEGKGQLTLPDMTIDSVLRLHTFISYTDTLQPFSIMQEERYQWYSLYCRYPILENIVSRAIKGNDTISVSSAYYYPQEQENMPVHRQIKEEDIPGADSLITQVAYLPNPVQTDLQIQYTLIRQAQVYISLHYNGGTTVYQTPLLQEEEGMHSATIHMAGLPLGAYVVYIHADDTIVSGNVIKL